MDDMTLIALAVCVILLGLGGLHIESRIKKLEHEIWLRGQGWKR